MKVIDLLNKIANGKIDYTTKFDAKVNMGYCDINTYFERYPINDNYLNCEIELEGTAKEEKEIPEKLKDILKVDDLNPPVDENMYKIWKQTIKNQNKVNEICDYLKNKGDE